MPTYSDYRSLMADGDRSWHDGNATIRYDYITSSTVPGYYRDGFGYEVDNTFFSRASDLSMDGRQRAMMEQAVARWDEVANINLVRGGGSRADIAIGSADFGNDGLYGFAYYPSEFALGNYPSFSGDVWINNGFDQQYIPGVGPIHGHSSWYTYIHELGHALGLSHPNDDPNDPDSSSKYTVMSYLEHPSQTHESYDDGGWPVTPMVWDIQAIQALYGVNTETRSDATVYVGTGAGFDSAAERAFQYDDMQVTGEDGQARDAIFTIWDAGGTDLIDGSAMHDDAHIDLHPGAYSSLGGGEDNLAVAAAVHAEGRVINLVENAWGGRGNDVIHGNGTHNALHGNRGNDQIFGYIGDDQLHGGGGADRLHGQHGDDQLLGNYGPDRLFGNEGNDRLFGHHGNDLLRGQDGADRLFGGERHDRLFGGRGNDKLAGGGGNDQLTGGQDADVFLFSRGADRVLDFDASEGDQISLIRTQGITGFQDLTRTHLRNTTDGVLIEDARGDSLLLLAVNAEDLSADHFIF
ncbi:matrixin family metalloprotease [Epibacterium sp. SM1969]|uniref:Matrixin family metalloprotease n=1 Tax=Tritonibacter aquimaris TaxID=2663379 RepID=A0A844B1F9_9RHOB|nr:M10 family metallopeptidase [Tritonibacter aquimaris]MQY44162.1 matrixin family metalloprotease [Tritonibacter aquimaris]